MSIVKLAIVIILLALIGLCIFHYSKNNVNTISITSTPTPQVITKPPNVIFKELVDKCQVGSDFANTYNLRNMLCDMREFNTANTFIAPTTYIDPKTLNPMVALGNNLLSPEYIKRLTDNFNGIDYTVIYKLFFKFKPDNINYNKLIPDRDDKEIEILSVGARSPKMFIVFSKSKKSIRVRCKMHTNDTSNSTTRDEKKWGALTIVDEKKTEFIPLEGNENNFIYISTNVKYDKINNSTTVSHEISNKNNTLSFSRVLPTISAYPEWNKSTISSASLEDYGILRNEEYLVIKK